MPTKMSRRIAVVLPNLAGGGAERMHLDLAREWLKLGLNVDFVLLRKEGELLDLVPHGSRIVDLEVPCFRDALWPLMRYIRKARPDVVLAAMWPLTVVAVFAGRMAGCGARIVVSDHEQLSISYAGKGAGHRLFLRSSMAVGYRLAHERIAVSRGVARDLARLSGIPAKRYRVIYNPAAKGEQGLEGRLSSVPENAGPFVLSVGKFKAVKNHALLIEAFAQIADKVDVNLYILGEGALRPELERKIAALGLEERVFLPGFQHDTILWYQQAQLFVLSSNHEGFGNVLVEALEQGVPVVSTDCPSGPREILENGRYGRLVPVGDAGALAQAMLDELNHHPDPEVLKRRAADFRVDRIAREYLRVMFGESRITPGLTGR